MAFVPELFYDSMVYHLGVPNWYLLEGGIKVLHGDSCAILHFLRADAQCALAWR